MAENGVVRAWSSFLSADIIATAPSYDIVWPLDPASVFIDKNVFTGCCCKDYYEERATSLLHPFFPAFPWKLNFWSFFSHFSPFVLAYGQPLDPVSTFIVQYVITGDCCNDIYGERATLGYYHPTFPPLCLKIEFWGIFSHFSPFEPAYGWPHDPISPLLPKM